MTPSEATRLHYLNAMGITIWQSRFSSESTASESAPIIFVENSVALAPDAWKNLQTDVSNCQLCNLCTTRTQTVFGEGNESAKWLLIAETPEQEENGQSHPFIGESRELLTEMLRAMNLTPEDVFITNILKCSTPENRNPHASEIKQCRNYLQRQITLIQPKIIIAIGRIAAQTLLEKTEKIDTLRQQIHYVENIPLIAIYHPSYLLGSLIEKRKAWQDLQFALQTFKTLTD